VRCLPSLAVFPPAASVLSGKGILFVGAQLLLEYFRRRLKMISQRLITYIGSQITTLSKPGKVNGPYIIEQ
jgi:hypothetical protein